jgi:hypothetical protein
VSAIGAGSFRRDHDGHPVEPGHVDFRLTGSRHYRNADRVAHLYNYLLSGACNALEKTEELRLVDDHATAESELTGPFQVPMPLIPGVSCGDTLVDADGRAVRGAIAPGTDLYCRAHFGDVGRRHGDSRRWLSIPADGAVEFDITCQTDESCTETA